MNILTNLYYILKILKKNSVLKTLDIRKPKPKYYCYYFRFLFLMNSITSEKSENQEFTLKNK